MTAACLTPTHDHTPYDEDGNPLAEGTYKCTDCHADAHYDDADGWYHHNDPDTPACFLAGHAINPCSIAAGEAL